jgi:hypothetical protein
LSDIEENKAEDERREQTANLVIEKIRHDFGLRTELLNGVVGASGKKIDSDRVKLTPKQLDYVNANHGDIPISFKTRFKETPVVTVTYMNLIYARPGDARNTLKTAKAICTETGCMVSIRWTDPRVRSNEVISKLQLYWAAHFPMMKERRPLQLLMMERMTPSNSKSFLCDIRHRARSPLHQ